MSYPIDPISDFRHHTSRTAAMEAPDWSPEERLLSLMSHGLTGEAGEVADEIKKILGHGKPVDLVKIANECGDVLFYLARVLAHFGLDLGDAMQANVAKLLARYDNSVGEAFVRELLANPHPTEPGGAHNGLEGPVDGREQDR